MNSQDFFIKSLKLPEESIEFQLDYYSAADTLYYAYKEEEQAYLKAVNGCTSAKPFMEALRDGSSCNIDVTVFKRGNRDGPLFTFSPDGCVIEENDSSCESGQRLMLSIGKDNSGGGVINPIKFYAYEFYISNLIPEKSTIEFLAVINDLTHKRILGGERKRIFALVDNIRNLVHLEADGRVTQQSLSPTDRCPGESWDTLKSFNPMTLRCEDFSILGGAEGLAFYNGRFFSMRSFDGQIFDMLPTTMGGGSPVLENGTLVGQKVFPNYSKNLLVNTDDITIIGDTLYYVAGGGVGAHLGLLDTRTSPTKRTIVCPLGQMGWAQSYDGVAATSRSHDLLDKSKIGSYANFYLKTSGGDLLYLLALINSSGNYECYGVKDQNLQRVEYKRSYGFDRTEDRMSLYHY